MSIIRRALPSQRLLQAPFKKIWDPFFSFPTVERFEKNEFTRLNAINISERKNDLVVEVEVPGFKKEDLELFVKDDTITLKGKISAQDQEEKVLEEVIYSNIHSKRYNGEFSRSLTFTEKIDPAKMSASLDHGVLTILLPKQVGQVEQGTRVDIS